MISDFPCINPHKRGFNNHGPKEKTTGILEEQITAVTEEIEDRQRGSFTGLGDELTDVQPGSFPHTFN